MGAGAGLAAGPRGRAGGRSGRGTAAAAAPGRDGAIRPAPRTRDGTGAGDAPGRPFFDRAALVEADTARRAGTAETGRYRQQTAAVDDSDTTAVDEHADAAGQAAPHLARAAGDDAKARSLTGKAPVGKTPVGLAGEDFSQPVTAAPRPAVQTRPAVAAPARQRTPAQTAITAGRTR